jgi:hypothetical protein
LADLESPLDRCPQCGSEIKSELEEPQKIKTFNVSLEEDFTSILTLKLFLEFGPLNIERSRSSGSISFGKRGMSIIWEEGRRWERIPYEQIINPRVVQESIIMAVSTNEVETVLKIFHPWLPTFLTFPTKARAHQFFNLMVRAKNGLTDTEVAFFKRVFGN